MTRYRFVQWLPREGSHEERLQAMREERCHHDYWSRLVEVPAPTIEAGTAETPSAAPCEARERDGNAGAPS